MTVDKLGVKLYDRVSAVIAELVANSYDADAQTVTVSAPMNMYLSTKQGNQIVGLILEVHDDGIGMEPEEVNDFYLRVGAERRLDSRRGTLSKIFKRKVMGRKGVGKLAPFGICQQIEVITSGGDKITGPDKDGNIIEGFRTAHFILDRAGILDETDMNYEPTIGILDETVSKTSGTILRLRDFAYRFVPSLDDLERQLAQRFGIQTSNWRVTLVDINPQIPMLNQTTRDVGLFQVPQMTGTGIRLEQYTKSDDTVGYRALNQDGEPAPADIEAGFWHDQEFYPVLGWAGYSDKPYKDDLMAGIRIYCRGKIASQTHIFNMKAGFTGEYDIRSYLVGELHADWLDEEEDLIQTDRRDILWSHELGQAFEKWGQHLVKKIGVSARQPMKKKTWDVFRTNSGIDSVIGTAFPLAEQKPIRDKALELAKMIGQTMREDEAQDPDQAKIIVALSLTLAPHLTLDTKLREAADDNKSPLAVITGLLKMARIAELSSFGLIAEERIRVISRIEELKDDAKTLEQAFQQLIEQAPWLINPQWAPISANQTFTTLKKEFEKYYEHHTKQKLQLSDFTDPTKRADFVLSNQDRVIQVIEIKRPHHAFENEEMVRLNTYVEQLSNFLEDPMNKEFTRSFETFHVTLVCDTERLTGLAKTAFQGLLQRGILTHIDWKTFLMRTRQMHEQFLNEADRQKRDAAQSV